MRNFSVFLDFSNGFLIKCYLVVYRLTEYIGYLFTFCSFFLRFYFFYSKNGTTLGQTVPS